MPIAMKQGDTLSYLHHDYLGSLVSATDASGNELGWVRYDPFGSVRLSGGTVPSNRLFIGQPRGQTLLIPGHPCIIPTGFWGLATSIRPV